MAAHIIRLREPWERTRLENGDLLLKRKFNLPTGLEASSRVDLVIEALAGLNQVRLNSTALAQCERQKWEITSLLQNRNEICLVVNFPAGSTPVDFQPQVRLEIGEGEALATNCHQP